MTADTLILEDAPVLRQYTCKTPSATRHQKEGIFELMPPVRARS